MEQQIEELTLLLLYLTSWEENVGKKKSPLMVRRSWKGYPFDILKVLTNNDDVRGSFRAKSVILTDQGITRAKELERKYLH